MPHRNAELAGRNPTKVLYSVGFEDSGRITSLDIRGWMQCGALLDLAFNDAGVLQTAADQASIWHSPY